MLPTIRLTDSDLDNLHRLYARSDVVRRATACRDAGRWLACLWLLVVGVAALQERREEAR